LKPEPRHRFEAWMTAIGTTFPIRFVDPVAGKEGIRAVEFQLVRALDQEKTLRFGDHSILVIRMDRTATWDFN
jgi:hypothetical protein